MHEDDSAVGVHITNFKDLVFRTEETEPEHFSFQTLLVQPGQGGGSVGTGGQPGQQMIAQLDPLRKEISIWSVDAPIAICDSSQQASRPWNTIGGLLVPDGAYMAVGQSYDTTGTAAIYVSCLAATRVVVTQTRRAA